MEEEKATAYYDEVARKGEGAARFKQGLGFTSLLSRDSFRESTTSSSSPSSSFLSSFVRASSPSKISEFQRQKQLENIQKKLKKKSTSDATAVRSSADENLNSGKDSRLRYGSRGNGERHRGRRRRRRSRSRSGSDGEGFGTSRVCSNELKHDYSLLIRGYEKMSSADKLKARVKFQLADTAKKDTLIGKGSGWERFEFDKNAPLDDQEMEVADDDTAVVQRIGQSFRLSTIEARKAEDIKTAHDRAMFGAPPMGSNCTDDDGGEEVEERRSPVPPTQQQQPPLFSHKVLVTQRGGSWRDRAGRGEAAA